MKNYKILIIGLGSIGKNLALSLIDKGYEINVWDKNQNKNMAICKYLRINYIKNIFKFIKTNNTIIILAIPAGLAIDNLIYKNINFFKKKNYIIDIGNSHPNDTIRRHIDLKKYKINYIGCGFSGGIHGARTDASLMVGCSKKNFRFLNKLFLDIIGKKNKKFLKRISDNPSAGHYAKIIHNGIEYGVMQSIADYYLIMKEIIKLNDNEIIREISKLNKLIGDSHLLEITKKIIEKSKSNRFLISNILDKVDDNNTGAWTVSLAANCKFPIPSISSSVEARFISRQQKFLKKIKIKRNNNKIQLKKIKNKIMIISKLSIICCYLQGIGLLEKISDKKKISINLRYVLLSWMTNSIIRSNLLKKYFLRIKNNKIDINSLVQRELSLNKRKSLINIMIFLTNNNLYLPSINSTYIWTSLATQKKNIAFSLIQGQRNYFGGHKIKFYKN